MNEMPWFEVRAKVPIALALDDGETSAPSMPSSSAAPAIERARGAVARTGLHGPEVRDAFRTLVASLDALRKELDHLTQRLDLQQRGVTLTQETVQLSGATLKLKARSWALDTRVRVWLSLHVRESQHLLIVPAVVSAHDGEHMTLTFAELADDERDLIVAFTLQQQAKERRRALQ